MVGGPGYYGGAPHIIPSHLPKIRANPHCHKCHGTGYKVKKGEYKVCKSCKKSYVGNVLTCTKCGGSGYKLKNGKHCKCMKGMYKRVF